MSISSERRGLADDRPPEEAQKGVAAGGNNEEDELADLISTNGESVAEAKG